MEITVLDALPAQVAVLDHRGTIVWVNASWRTFGQQNGSTDPSAGCGRNYMDVCRSAGDPQSLAMAQALSEILDGDRQEYSAEYPCPRETQDRWFQVRIAPCSWQGHPGAVVLHVNVTTSHSIRDALRASEQQYRTVVETAEEGVWMINADARTLLVNQKMASLLGVTVEQLQSSSLYDFLDQPERRLLTQHLRDRRAGKRARYDFRLQRPDGSDLWVMVASSPVFHPDGRFLGSLKMMTDITERRQAEAAVAASLREKELLLRELHHRVKNNLQVICSLLQLHTSQAADPATVAVLEESQQRVRSIALIHELTYRSPDLEHIDLSDYIRTLAPELFHVYGVNDETIRLTMDLESVVISPDRGIPCGLIINELISNCLKHAFPAGSSGHIYIELKKINRALRLVIRDNGIGLSEGADQRHATTLGLRLAATLADQLQGRLELQSGGGTTVTVSIPEDTPHESSHFVVGQDSDRGG